MSLNDIGQGRENLSLSAFVFPLSNARLILFRDQDKTVAKRLFAPQRFPPVGPTTLV
jgi:hypothetical protein